MSHAISLLIFHDLRRSRSSYCSMFSCYYSQGSATIHSRYASKGPQPAPSSPVLAILAEKLSLIVAFSIADMAQETKSAAPTEGTLRDVLSVMEKKTRNLEKRRVSLFGVEHVS